MFANPDDSSIADIFVTLWRCMTPAKRANTIAALETLAEIDETSPVTETQYALFLVDQIVNSQVLVPVQV